MKHLKYIGGLALVFAAGLPVSAQESVEAIEKSVTENWNKLSSLSADVETKMEQSNPSYSMKNESKGKFEYAKIQDVPYFRMEATTNMQMSQGGQEQKMDSTNLMVSDGKVMFAEVKMLGQTQVMKLPTSTNEDPLGIGGSMIWSSLRESMTLAALPSVEINGKSTHVVEGTMKDQQTGISKNKFHFDKETGLLVRLESYDMEGKMILHTNTTNIKTNPEISPSRFRYTPPEGAMVQDMTQPQQAPAPAAP